MMSNILSYCNKMLCHLIHLIHVALVLFIVVTPFLKVDVLIMFLHAVLVPCILFHWLSNDNTCCLTILEQALRKNCDKEQLFFQRLVGPVYEPRHDSLIVAGMLYLMYKSTKDVYERKEELKTNLRLTSD